MQEDSEDRQVSRRVEGRFSLCGYTPEETTKPGDHDVFQIKECIPVDGIAANPCGAGSSIHVSRGRYLFKTIPGIPISLKAYHTADARSRFVNDVEVWVDADSQIRHSRSKADTFEARIAFESRDDQGEVTRFERYFDLETNLLFVAAEVDERSPTNLRVQMRIYNRERDNPYFVGEVEWQKDVSFGTFRTTADSSESSEHKIQRTYRIREGEEEITAPWSPKLRIKSLVLSAFGQHTEATSVDAMTESPQEHVPVADGAVA